MSTNAERANRAISLLEAYAEHFGDLEDFNANLTDLLADLMHLVNQRIVTGVSFEKALELATLHFQDEIQESLTH